MCVTKVYFLVSLQRGLTRSKRLCMKCACKMCERCVKRGALEVPVLLCFMYVNLFKFNI